MTVADALDRHHRRRRDGIPTITVLVGSAPAALAAWNAWIDEVRGHSIAFPSKSPASLVAPVLEHLDRHGSPIELVARWLARRTGRSRAELAKLARTQETSESEVLALLRDLPDSTPAQLGRAIVERIDAPHDRARAEARARTALADRDPAEVLSALLEMCPGARPALLVLPPREADVHRWLEEHGPVLVRVAEERPALALAVALPRKAVSRAPGDVRWWAVMREGAVEIPSLSESQIGEQIVRAAGAEAAARCQPAIRRLARDGAGSEVVAAFAGAAAARRTGDGLLFRSKVEEFLYRWLESQPETNGEFEPNVPLKVNPGRIEIDLLARQLKLAIEIDGVFHFRDLDAYRRDRSKDLELQRRGYWVVRYLADDVMDDLERVGREILAVVAQRPGG